MGRVIDDRVVEMRFDNKDFEKNVSQSLSTLDKLKSALKIGNSATSEFDSVMDAADSLGGSFNVLENIAVGAFRRMGEGVYEWAAKTIIDMTGVQNVLSGFRKYEDVTNMMAKLHYQGYDDKEAKKTAEFLNWFTDETSYDYVTMGNVMSVFTSSGIGLDDSAHSMMGIALAAAMAGVEAQGASHAMVQLGQAIGRNLNAKDWASLQTVGMDTAEFRQQLLDAAVACGTLQKGSNGLYRSLQAKSKKGATWFGIEQVPNMLTEGAFATPEVQKTLYMKYASVIDDIYAYWLDHGGNVSDAIDALREKKADDATFIWGLNAFEAAQEARTWSATINSIKETLSTGWMNAFQKIFGYYGEAKEFFGTLVDDLWLFVEPVTRLNEILDLWRDLGGRDDFIAGILGVVEGILNIISMFGEAISEVFRKEDAAKGLANISKALKYFGQGLLTITEHLDPLKYTLEGLFAVLDIGWQIVSGLTRAFFALFKGTSESVGFLTEGLFAVTGGIGKLFVKLDHAIKDGDIFYKIFSFLFKPLEFAKDKITWFIEFVEDNIPTIWTFLKEKFKELAKLSGPIGKAFGTAFDFISKKFEQLRGMSFIEFFDKVKKKSIDAANSIPVYWELAKNKVVEFYDKAKSAFYEFTGLGPGELFKKIGTGLSIALQYAKKALQEFGTWASENLGGFWEFLKKTFKNLADFFGKVGKGLFDFLSRSDFSGPKKVLMAIWETIKIVALGIGAAIYGLYKLLGPLFEKLKTLFINFFEGGLTFSDLLEAVKTLAGFESARGFHWLADALSSIAGAADYWGKSKLIKSIARSLLMIAAALFVITLLDTDKLLKNGGAFATFLTIIFGELGLANKSLKNTAKMQFLGKTIRNVAMGILLMAAALWVISKIPTKQLLISAGVLAALMLLMAAAIAIIAKQFPDVLKKSAILNKTDKKGKKSHMLAGTILAIGLSLIMLAAALKIISTIDSDNMGPALLGLLAASIILAGTVIAIDKLTKNLKPTAASALLLTALSLVIVGLALKMLGKMDWKQLAVGCLGLLAVAVALGGVAFVIGKFAPMFRPANGAAMLLLAVSFFAVALVLKMLASMPMEKMIQALEGFIVIAAVMGVLGVVFSKFPMSALAGVAMLAMGGAFILIAESLLIIAAAVAIFGKMDREVLIQGAIAVAALVGGIALLSNLGMGPNMLAMAVAMVIFAKAMLIFIAVITAFGTMSIDTLKQGGIALAVFLGIILLAGAVALIVGPGLLALSAVLLALGASTLMTGVGLNLIKKGIDGLYKSLGKIRPVVNGLLDGLSLVLERLPEFVIEVTRFLTALLISTLDAFVQSIPMIAEAFVSFILAVLEYLAYGDALPRILEAIFTIIGILLEKLEEHIGEWIETLATIVMDILIGIIDGISNRIGELIDSLFELIVSIIEGVADAIDQNAKAFVDAVTHLKTAIFRALLLAITGGYVDLYGAGEDGAQQTYEGFKTKIQNLFASIGGWLHQHLFKPIADWFVETYESFKSLGRNIWEGIKAGIEEALKGIKKWWNEKAIGWMPEEVRKFFEIASPSKLMARLGGYIMEGLGVGLSDGMSSPLGAVNSANNGILSGFTSLTDKINDLLNNNINTSPTITPVLDLTNLESGSSSISSMFGGIDLGSGKANLAALASGLGTEDLGFDPNDPMSGRMVFNQYNYSPKALSATEIYRQTRNQLSGAKGVVIQKR